MKKAVEIERKFVILLPDISSLEDLDGYSRSEIEQIYLESEKGRTHRIRSRRFDGATVYTETEKIRIDAISAFENEKEIDCRRFSELRARQRKDSRVIEKTRITFRFGERLFEVDVYPEWKRTAIMEVELPERDTEIDLPPFIEIVKEVTGDKAYSNASMSRTFPKELI